MSPRAPAPGTVPHRIVWFVLLWAGGVAATAALALVIRLALKA